MTKPTGKFGSRNRNVALFGCAGAALVGIVGCIIIASVIRGKLAELRENFTSTQAIELPVVDVSEEERDSIIERVDIWHEAMEDGTATDALVLTSTDINVLIQNHDDLEEISNTVYVSIDDSSISGEVSFPLEGIPGFSGRYFNGNATFEVTFLSGRLSVFVNSAVVNGAAIPDEIMNEVSGENLAKDVHRDEDYQRAIENIESIEIIDGKLIISPKGANSVESTVEEEETAGV